MGVFDHASKRPAEEDRRAFLSLAGCLDLHQLALAVVKPLEREVITSEKIADHLFLVREIPAGDWRIEHIEALATWRVREVEEIIERAMAISIVPKLRKRPLRTTILLMRPGGARTGWPGVFRRDRGCLESRLTVRYRMVWRMKARELFAMGRLTVLPLVPLTIHTERDIRDAWEKLHAGGSEDLMSQFLSHARVLYDEDELRRICGVLEDVTLELIKDSKPVKKVARASLEKGRREGERKGERKGLRAVRDNIRALIADRFPRMTQPTGIDSLDFEEAAVVFARLLRAKSPDEVRNAFRS